ncbi:hypothetical protein GEMRC1_008722 [Eukaryota sp. GEM-RC1]
MLSGIQTAQNNYPKPVDIKHSRNPSSTLSDESATQPLSPSPPPLCNNTKRTTRTKRNPFTCSICGLSGHTKANKKFHP